MKSYIKLIFFYFSSLINYKKNKIFTTIFDTSNSTGPGRFMFNLEQYVNSQNRKVERLFLGRASSALIFSMAPFKSFYSLCRRNNILTVLRVDGFYVPTIFDGIESEFRQKRSLDEDKIAINQGMQYGIFKADWVIYQSEFSKVMADKYLCKRNENYSIVYNGVNTEHFKPLDMKKNINKTVLLLGSWRDLDLLICSLNAFKYFYQENKDSRLRIIGGMSEDNLKSIKEWVDNNLINICVEIVGKVSYEELPQEINKCDVSLHLKSGDWCPNAVLETMACGVPVICQEYGGTKELVGDKNLIISHEKFCYDVSLSKKASEKLEMVFDDIDKYKTFSRKKIEENFTLEKSSSDYFKIFN